MTKTAKKTHPAFDQETGCVFLGVSDVSRPLHRSPVEQLQLKTELLRIKYNNMIA